MVASETLCVLSAVLVPSVKGHWGDNNSEEERTAECVGEGEDRAGPLC